MSASAHLPYSRHVNSSTIVTRDGLLMQTIQLGGFLFETANTEELNYRARLRDSLLQTIASSRIGIYHHILRRKAEVTLNARFEDEFSRVLDRKWRERLAKRELYVNDLFLTIVRRPLQGRGGVFDRVRNLFFKSDAEQLAARNSELRALENATQAVMATLGDYTPRLLTIRDTEQGYRSEPLEFLGCLFNAEMRPMVLPERELGGYLPFRRISFGHEAFELARAGNCSRKFGAVISVKDYPSHTLPGMFDELYRLPCEMAVAQSFAFVERTTALSSMQLTLRRMRSAEDEAVSLRDELSRAKDDVASGRAGFGEHHTTITLYGESLSALDASVAEVSAVLADLGIVGVREDIGLESAYWAQFPGNFKYIVRRGLVSTANFAGFASLHNFPIGQANGNHWGEAVTLLETTAAGPYFFNFHHHDLGNFTIIGPSGSGKTVVLNFLLAQAGKFRPRIVFFDKDRGAELFIRAIGGRYDRLRPGIQTGLNPLQLPDTPDNRQFLLDWMMMLAGPLDPAEVEMVKDALNASSAMPPQRRRLSVLVELFRGRGRPTAGDLYARMRPWWGDGEYAWLFDNEADTTDLSERTIAFDMTAVLDDPKVRTPALFYFFHRVEQRLDGSPTILVVDEGWKALDDEVFVRRIKDWEKTIRKRNGIIGFATQSAQDALESRIASAIIEQAATQIFMINPKAKAEDYIDGFGLTPHEFELVRSLPDNSHCFLVKHGNESVVARLNLSGEKELLTILSGREETVRIFDELESGGLAAPDQWIAALMERV